MGHTFVYEACYSLLPVTGLGLAGADSKWHTSPVLVHWIGMTTLCDSLRLCFYFVYLHICVGVCVCVSTCMRACVHAGEFIIHACKFKYVGILEIVFMYVRICVHVYVCVCDLVKSFHSGMMARVRVDGTLLDNIDVSNGLR